MRTVYLVCVNTIYTRVKAKGSTFSIVRNIFTYSETLLNLAKKNTHCGIYRFFSCKKTHFEENQVYVYVRWKPYIFVENKVFESWTKSHSPWSFVFWIKKHIFKENMIVCILDKKTQILEETVHMVIHILLIF